MFNAKTPRLRMLARHHPGRVEELGSLFGRSANIYIDWANVFYWRDRLGWHVDIKRTKQLLDSFPQVRSVKFYAGTLVGNRNSELMISTAGRLGYDVRTKPVKIMRLSIDASSVPANSPDLLKDFVSKPLLRKLRLETVEALNEELRILNRQGVRFVEEMKANFDVEIGRDMLRDYDVGEADTFVLWSGDSDFADPVRQLLRDGKRVVLLATSRKVATELSVLRSEGLVIFDIQKAREFICRASEMSHIPQGRDDLPLAA
jgi:uncharacterized LabA/DUF88 family protein